MDTGKSRRKPSGTTRAWFLENLEESVVRTGRDFPAGGNPCLSKGLTGIHALQIPEV